MKWLFIRLFLMILLIIGISQKSMAQVLCTECESCEEDTEYSADIEEGEGEMNIEEADMMGTEESEAFVEEAGEIAEEGASEIGEVAAEGVTEVVEVGAEDLSEIFLEFIPGVGELLQLLILPIFITDIKKEVRQMRIFHEHQDAIILSGGKYSLPMLPNFSLSVDDLNGKKDKVSYMFFLNKRLDKDAVKKYLTNRNMTDHINKSYSGDPKNSMQYAFSKFTINDGSKKDRKGNSINTEYDWNIPNIKIYKDSNSKWYYQYTANWNHTQNHSIPGKEERFISQSNYNGQSITHHFKDIYELNTSFSTFLSGPLSFWICQEEGGGLKYLKEVPKKHISIKDIGRKIVVRIKDLSLESLEGRYPNKPLFITLRVNSPELWVNSTINDKDGSPKNVKAFPEDWNPTVYSSTKYTKSKKWRNNNYKLGGKIHKFEDSGIYPNTKGLEPKIVYGNLLHFQIHDYQPKDTQATIAIKKQKNGEKIINPFPTIHSSKRIEYDNQTIDPAVWGTNHFQVDIPYYRDNKFKDIQHVQIEVLNKPIKVILLIEEKLRGFAINLEPRAYYNTSNTRNNEIKVKEVVITDDYMMGDGRFKEKATIIREPDKIRKWSGGNIKSLLLHDVPIHPGDIIDISVYYKDGSLSRDVHAVKVSGGEVERSIYTLKDRATASYLSENGNQIMYRNSPSDYEKWMIEYLGSGDYAIMNQKSLKVLGIVDGKVGMYEWDHDQKGLLWTFDFSGGANTVKMINVDQQAYLKQTGFNFKESTEFLLQKHDEATSIISSEEELFLQNQGQKKILGVNSLGDAFLTLDKESFSSLELQYYGCYQYTLFDKNREEYLYYDKQNGIRWDSKRKTGWWINRQGDNILLTDRLNESDLHVLGLNSQSGKLSMVPVDKNKSSLNNLKNQFKKLKKLLNNKEVDMIAHYAFENDFTDSSGNEHHATKHGDRVSIVNDFERGPVASFHGEPTYSHGPNGWTPAKGIGYVDTNFDFNPKNYNGDITVSLWIKNIKGMSPENTDVIGASTFRVRKHSDRNEIRLWLKGNHSFSTISMKAGGVPDEAWHHVAISIDSQEDGKVVRNIYIDGKLVTSRHSIFSFTDTIGNTILGNYFEKKDWATYGGYMDDVMFWGGALNENEIYRIYEDTKKDPIVNSRISARSLQLRLIEAPNSSSSSLIIYPNPSKSHGIFNIKFDLAKASIVKYNIVNFSGNILQSDSQRFKKGNHIWKIKTDQLPKGIYMIKVISKEWEENRNILVNK